MSNSNKFSVCTGETRITGDQLRYLQDNGYVISAVYHMPGDLRLTVEFEGSEENVDGVMTGIVQDAFPHKYWLKKAS